MRFFRVTATIKDDEGTPKERRPRYVNGLEDLNEVLVGHALNPDHVKTEIVPISEAEYVENTHPKY